MHERKLIRLSGFDYSSTGNYFVTICVKNHLHTFGKVENNSMILSPEGNIALEQWKWLGEQYQFIDLISFVIMPDHVHGIIRIDANYFNDLVAGNGRDHSMQPNHPHQPGCKIKSLPELIGAYKTTVSKRIHLAGNGLFKWQKSYYEHIIRNNRAMNLIKHYIETNPEHWM